MKEKVENQIAPEDKKSKVEDTTFGGVTFQLWDDTIKNVSTQMKVAAGDLSKKKSPDPSKTVSCTLGILRSCVAKLQLLQLVEKEALNLRNQIRVPVQNQKKP